MPPKPSILCLAALLAAAPASGARRPGDPLKPGFNLFSKQQDVQLGEANSKQVLQQYQVVKNQFLQDYVRRVGTRLAEAPEAKQSGFQFNFTVLNVPEINAFALPGGPMFIYTGLLNACDNEAQLAGVMGHEMSHVILRHGTHEATKANLIQLPAMLAGAVIGNEGTMARLANMGLGLGANSFILKFSRDAETEADALGSHLMAAAGYDPVQMARFFEKLTQGPQPPQILSDHPNPGNREKAIQAEVQLMPARASNYQTGEFARMKSELKTVPPPPAKAPATPQPVTGSPSGTWKNFEGQSFAISYPDNWQVFGDRDSSSVTIAPRDGLVTQGGNTQVGYGAILSYFMTESKSRPDLRAATDDLVHHLKVDNPRMEVSKPARAAKIAGVSGLITALASNSPFGGNEVDWLVTVMRPQGLFYVVFIAPEKDSERLQDTLQKMLDSLRFQ
jgi:peptidase M48-like protein